MSEEQIEALARRLVDSGPFIRALVVVIGVIAAFLILALLVMLGYNLAAGDMHFWSLSYPGALGVSLLIVLIFGLSMLLKETK